MSPKMRFGFMIEPTQLRALQAIETRTGAPVSEQIRRAIQSYLETQTILTKAELKSVAIDPKKK